MEEKSFINYAKGFLTAYQYQVPTKYSGQAQDEQEERFNVRRGNWEKNTKSRGRSRPLIKRKSKGNALY